jgi:molybdenum-dependent DNA-binding transcriptional regulator ModE
MNVHETSGYPQLLRVIRYVRSRWRIRNTLKGVAFLVLFGLVAFAISAWGMEYFRYSAWSVRLFRIFTYIALLGLALRFLVRPLAKRVSNEQVALYIEEHDPSLKEAISSAVELGEPSGKEGTFSHRELSPALVDKLVEQTVERCESIDYGQTIERDALKRSSAVFLGVAAAGMIAVLLSPGFMRYGAGLLLNPMRSAQAASPYLIIVEPGDIGVARGADQLVTAELRGFDADKTDIAVKGESDVGWQRVPMSFDDETGRYTFMLFDLETPTEYYVEANGVSSDRFRVDVSDLPYVRQIDLEYRFPAYTGLSPQRVEDGGDIAALRGTEVGLTIVPTVKVAGGVLQIEEKDPVPLELGDDGNLSVSLDVTEHGFYRIDLEAFDGTLQPASPDYAIEVLSDQPPSVTIVKPGRDSKVNPIEEVFTEVKGEDDYGLRVLEMVYSVNGGEEQIVSLYGGSDKKEMVAGHTFFLEDYELQPGDFISYYARAKDAGSGQTATTDIYFIEARPFDRRYSQAQGGMPGGGGGGGGMEGTLSIRQREIVAATFKLIRDKSDYSQRDWEENLTTIALMQGRLREQVQNLLRRMTNRGITGMDGDFATISESLKKAIDEMGPAEEKLTAKDPDAAMPYEQRALQHLQRADAVFREVQVSFQQGGGGGGGQQASAEDLADLFELELDKLRNQYETVQRGQQQSVDNEVDEALQRLQELARRQQQENERLRRQANRLRNQGGGGGGANQRELADETEELARQLERLAREHSLPDLQDTARRLEQAANSMRRSGARGDDGALAEGLSALDKLKDARRLLDKNRSVRLERDLDDAMEQVDRIASQQERVQSEVEKMGAEGQGRGGGERLQRIFERKDELAEQVANLESQLDRMARDSRREQKEASRKIQDAANSIRDTKLKEKIRYSKGVVQSRSGEYADNFESVISEDIASLRERLGDAAGAIGESEEDQVAEAIEQTRDLVRNLESLSERIRERREAESRGLRQGAQDDPERQDGQQARQGQEGQQGQQGQEGQQGQQGQSGQPGQQQAQAGQQGQQGQQGQDGQQGQPGEGQQGGQRRLGAQTSIGAGGDSSPGAYQPGTFSTEELRQMRREFSERVSDAEGLRQELARQDLDVPDLGEIIRRMEEFDRKQIYLNPLGLEQLEEDVLTELKQFEYWLRRELEGLGEGELYLAGSDQVPGEYRKLVEEYFRSLSRER